MKRIALSGGGTGGHLYPALAIGEAFLAGGPDREILFIGSERGLESRVVPEAGLPFLALPSSGWRGKGASDRVRFLAGLARGVGGATAALRRFRPDALIATGSYVALPALIAARLLRIPYFLQEQNRVPGRVIQLMAPGARALFLGMEVEAGRLSAKPPRFVTGNPLRAAFLEQAAAARGERGALPRLLVFGGSRGATTINRAVAETLPALAGRLDFEALVQTGSADWEATRRALAPLGARARVLPYIENMPEEMAGSSLVLCRAGAMTLAEIALLGLPAVLVPYPNAVDDHQSHNAAGVAAAGAALVIPDGELRGARLGDVLGELLADPARLAAMGAASAGLARPAATAEILALAEKSLAGF